MRRTLLRWTIPLYALALVASHWVAGPEPAPGMVVGERPGADAATPVLLLHGCPGGTNDFGEAAELWPGRRLLIPELPFGPDMSLDAQAERLRGWLDTNGIARTHVVGRGLGGALAIQFCGAAEDRVVSLGLVDALGVEEMELLGDGQLNSLLHLAAGSLTWLADHLVPHFGALRRSPWNRRTAAQFNALDQGPLRGILEELDVPVRIVHGRSRRVLAGHKAATEHARVVPQAELQWAAGWTAPLSGIGDFPERAESGRAVARAAAAPDRLAAAAEPWVRKRLAGAAMWGMVVLLMVAMLTSEDLTCIGAGLLVWKGVLGFFPAVLGCFLGLLVGDAGLYLIGRWFGRPAFRVAPLRWFVSEEAIGRQAERFRDSMFGLIFTSRFLPGARVPVYVAAGVLKSGLLRFMVYLAVAALVWAPLLVGLSALMGETFLRWFGDNKSAALWGVAGIVLFLWLLVHKVLPLASWRGRRLALSTWRRQTRWEFWPRWKFYVPMLPLMAWLMFRTRSVSVQLLANPGMDNGGAVLERKQDIYAALEESEALPPWTLLPVESPLAERLAALEEFAAAHGQVVLKPDIGCRGSGVTMAADIGEARTAVEAATEDLILQPRLPGLEFGVFHERAPGAAKGRVTSVTAKELTRVTGDGRSNLETLILRDDRAVCMAPYFLKSLAGRLDEVPAAGEQIALGQLGTHCRGAVFLDANHLRSPELDAAMDRIAGCHDGFHIGRFDLRAPSGEALRAGEGLRIIELNGITAEPTHMYDPKHSVWYGWRTMAGVWRRVFEFGQANRDRGHECIGLWGIVRLAWRTFRS